MRYLKNRQTDEVRLIDDNADSEFYALLARRDDDRRQIWAQTGPQDPAVQALQLPGQYPANADGPQVPGATSVPQPDGNGNGNGDSETAPEPLDPAKLEKTKLADLEQLAATRGVADRVVATGQDGRVLKADVIKALTA